jgi:exonuclease VII large subunit
MQKSQTNWLRDHMRDYITNHSALDSPENVLSFQRSPNSKMNPGAAALDVVYQAAELIRDVDNYAAERHARAETLARQAIEKLKIAHDCVQSAESRRLAAEAGIKEFSDRLENELGVRLQDVEKVVEQTASRIAAAEAQLSAAEQRARDAEIRADEAEKALKRIEETIRARILEKQFGDSGRRATVAA